MCPYLTEVGYFVSCFLWLPCFQRHSDGAKASPSALPDRPSATLQNTIEPDEVEEWWQTMSDPAPVPPLFLQSPTEPSKEHDWWPGTHKSSNHIGEDFLQNGSNNLDAATNDLDVNVTDFNLVEGNLRIKPDKLVSRREDVPKLFLDDLLEDEGESKRRRAAVNIQRWYRGWKTRKELSGQSAVKQLLSQKKLEKEKQMFSNNSTGLVCIVSSFTVN